MRTPQRQTEWGNKMTMWKGRGGERLPEACFSLFFSPCVCCEHFSAENTSACRCYVEASMKPSVCSTAVGEDISVRGVESQAPTGTQGAEQSAWPTQHRSRSWYRAPSLPELCTNKSKEIYFSGVFWGMWECLLERPFWALPKHIHQRSSKEGRVVSSQVSWDQAFLVDMDTPGCEKLHVPYNFHILHSNLLI